MRDAIAPLMQDDLGRAAVEDERREPEDRALAAAERALQMLFPFQDHCGFQPSGRQPRRSCRRISWTAALRPRMIASERHVRLAQRLADGLCGALDGAGAGQGRRADPRAAQRRPERSGNSQAGGSSRPGSRSCRDRRFRHAGPSASLRRLRLMASPNLPESHCRSHRPDRLLVQRLLRIFLPARRLPVSRPHGPKYSVQAEWARAVWGSLSREMWRPGRQIPAQGATIGAMPSRADPLKQIAAFNRGRNPELLALKYRKMAATPFGYFRGTNPLFHADWPGAAWLERMPAVWLNGDLHIENFGTYRGDNRLVYFDIGDFDDGALGPARARPHPLPGRRAHGRARDGLRRAPRQRAQPPVPRRLSRGADRRQGALDRAAHRRRRDRRVAHQAGAPHPGRPAGQAHGDAQGQAPPAHRHRQGAAARAGGARARCRLS